ncbi:MAG: c-type cytochrome [Chitinophagales bacterium]|nr:c-type cytochrome [Chitinophagales bacterium]MDW8418813.1 cytochrome c peroxidase [Chitinophagales bacterium]
MRYAWLAGITALWLFCLTECKPDDDGDVSCGGPDSLYTATPLTLAQPFKFPPIKIPEDNPLTQEGVLLGRMLFYDPVLSVDSTLSCAGCHKQEYAFSDGGKAFSQSVFGATKRNTPPIFNVLWMKNFFWDGRAHTLPLQVSDALRAEQDFSANVIIPRLEKRPEYVALFNKAFGKPCGITEEKIHKALSQFMMTLISADSKFDKVMRGQAVFTPSEYRGFYELFMKDTGAVNGYGADCFHCHANSSGASNLTMMDNNFHNNALQYAPTMNDFADKGRGAVTNNMLDNGLFRTPHIRNIEVTAPYMHNGQFNTLEEVIEFYNSGLKYSPTTDPQMKTVHRGGLQYLTAQDKADLVAFLKTLTDTAFLRNPAFSNPFK